MQLKNALGIQIVIIAALSMSACSTDNDRKIRLSTDENRQSNLSAASTVLQLEPEDRQTITILPFENHTGDESLDWLSRGLADMLATELSQSLFFNIVPFNMLQEKLQPGQQPDAILADAKIAAEAARKAKVETLVTGSFKNDRDGITIDVHLRDVSFGGIVQTESVAGESLDRILVMITELSDKLQAALRDDRRDAPKSVHVASMTHSIDAFKCYSEALDYMDRVQYAKADECLVKAVALDKTFASAYLRLAVVKYKIGDVGASAKALKRAREYADKLSEPDRLLLGIFEAKEKGDTENLVKGMQTLLEFEPYDLDTRMQLADYLRKFCQYDRAVEQYETVLEIEGEHPVVYRKLAQLYADRGDFHQALWYADQYELLSKDDPDPYYIRGNILIKFGHFEEARQQYHIALSKGADFYRAARQLSEVYSEQGNLDEAIKYAEQWLKQEPNTRARGRALADRANLYWRFGKISEAEKTLQQAREAAPLAAMPVLLSGALYKSLGEPQKVETIYHDYLAQFEKMNPATELDQYLLYDLLQFCADTDLKTQEKIRMLKGFAKSESRPLYHQFYNMHLGILYLRNKDYERANRYFASMSDEYLNLVMQFPEHTGWSSTWKYSVEAIKLQPKQEVYDFSSYTKMLENAKKAGRNDLAIIFNYFIAQYQARAGDARRLREIYLSQGTPREDEWRIAGPFENMSGFDKKFPPEKSFEQSFEFNGQSFSWRPAEDGAYDGYVDLTTAMNSNSWTVGYATVLVHSPDERKVQVRIAPNKGGKLWLNEKLVWQIYRRWEVPLDHDIVSVVLKKGDNRLLLKLVNNFGDWGFYLRVTDEDGKAFPDIRFKPVTKESVTVASR